MSEPTPEPEPTRGQRAGAAARAQARQEAIRVVPSGNSAGTGPKVRTPLGEAPILPLFLIIVGGYLAWYGIHYWRSDSKWPTDPLKAVLRGQAVPEKGQTTTADAILTAAETSAAGQGGGSGAAAGAVVTSSAIANAAQKYIGQGYVWGGRADQPGNWDCSSFVSYVLGHDLGMTLPGGGRYGSAGYPPHSHGPATTQYLLWGTPITRGQVRAGDLVVSTEHIGIAISNSQMVSAQDERLGVGIGNFPAGFPAGPPHYRRVA